MMEQQVPYRPRVARETRRLLTAGLVAVAVLWILARVRFQDQPVTSNPIPAVLTQIADSAGYSELAAEIARVRPRLEALLVPIQRSEAPRQLVGLRRGDDEVVTLLSPDSNIEDSIVLGRDGASGFAVVRVQGRLDAPLSIWTPRQLDQPRYLLVGEASEAGISLRPTFVDSLQPITTAVWPDAVWVLPAYNDLTPGAFLFTTSGGEFVGMVVARAGTRAVVPGATVLAEAGRLREAPRVSPGTLGVTVQALTPEVAMVTGSNAGVVVTSVARGASAAEDLVVGDVIEEIDGLPLTTLEQWDVRMGRLGVEERVNLRLRRRGQIAEVSWTARAITVPARMRALGLALHRRAGIGAQVDGVDDGSAGDRAGLIPGDIITLVDEIDAPTPVQVTRSFASLPPGQQVLLAVTRGDVHFVTTLER